MMPPRRCTCGARYERFRVAGLSYESTFASLLSGPDPETWRNKSRPAIMREMRRIKRERWDEIHRHCPDTIDVVVSTAPDNVIAFRTRAAAEAFARMRARTTYTPVLAEIKADMIVIDAYAGDHRGRTRRAS